MRRQGSGSLSATFVNPTPSACISTADYLLLPAGTRVPVCDGIGTNSISWGDPGSFGIGQSSFTFWPIPFQNVPLGQPFVMGTLTFYNGTIFVGTELTNVDLLIQSSSSDPGYTQTLGLPLRIFQTTNQNIDPIADADFLFFSDALQFGSFRVLEGQWASVEILGRFNSLDNAGFGRVTAESSPGAGFVSSSVEVVPEPETLGLFALGFVGLLGASRWRTNRRKA